jgi:hypothetical protein
MNEYLSYDLHEHFIVRIVIIKPKLLYRELILKFELRLRELSKCQYRVNYNCMKEEISLNSQKLGFSVLVYYWSINVLFNRHNE